MGSLKDQLEGLLPWLVTNFGFRIISESYDPKVFGDSMVVLQSDTLRLRIIRERGRVFAESAPSVDPENWWDLHLILEAMHREAPQQDDLPGVTALLRKNLPAILTALGPMLSETRQEVARLSHERLRATSDIVGHEKSGLRSQINRFRRTKAGRVLIHALGWLTVAFVAWMILSH
jgi:hypothetical protein